MYKIWDDFMDRIVSSNPFTYSKEVYELLDDIIDNHCNKKVVEKGSIYYRAREIPINDAYLNKEKQTDFEGFDSINSMAPPRKITAAGRINCNKLPILYLAEDKYTAIAEIKPQVDSSVSVATVEIFQNINVIDFTGFKTIGIENDDIEKIINDIVYIFSVPILKDEMERYIRTQFIAKYVESKSIDGIEYLSSQSEDGINLGIFNPEYAKAIKSKVYSLTSALYYIQNNPLINQDKEVIIATKFYPCNVSDYKKRFDIK